MKLSFAVLLAVANKWRGVRMDVFACASIYSSGRPKLD